MCAVDGGGGTDSTGGHFVSMLTLITLTIPKPSIFHECSLSTGNAPLSYSLSSSRASLRVPGKPPIVTASGWAANAVGNRARNTWESSPNEVAFTAVVVVGHYCISATQTRRSVRIL